MSLRLTCLAALALTIAGSAALSRNEKPRKSGVCDYRLPPPSITLVA
jgi:hypothetical protein